MAENKIPKFTQRDMEISANAWACLTGDVKIDFNKLAILGGYKNAASARECWRTTKIRLMAAAGVDKDGNSKGQQDQPETPSGKASKASKAGKPAATKRKRTKTVLTPTKAVDSNGDDEDEEDAGDGSPVPPKKVRRGAATTPGGGRKKKAIKTEETVIEPIFDAGEEQQMQQLNLSDINGGSIEDEVIGVDAMIKAEEQHNAQMSNAFEEI
ncbi:hypothetical protein PG984_013585 [Apiospora sp. TS-2023a]